MQRTLLLALTIVLTACAPFGIGDPFAGHDDPDRIGDVIDKPAGPVVELGEIPIVGTERRVTLTGFRNQAGGHCIFSSDGSGSCSSGDDQADRSLPASHPVGMGWSGGGEQYCVEADLQDGIDRAVVTRMEGEPIELRPLPASRQFGVNLFMACWLGGEPDDLETYVGDELAYRADF